MNVPMSNEPDTGILGCDFESSDMGALDSAQACAPEGATPPVSFEVGRRGASPARRPIAPIVWLSVGVALTAVALVFLAGCGGGGETAADAPRDRTTQPVVCDTPQQRALCA